MLIGELGLDRGEQQTNFYHERSEGNKADFGGWQSVLIVVLAIQENEKHAHEIAGEVPYKWHTYCLVKNIGHTLKSKVL